MTYGYYEQGRYVEAPRTERWGKFWGALTGEEIDINDRFFSGVATHHTWRVLKDLLERGGTSYDEWKCVRCKGEGHLGDPDYYDKWYQNERHDPPAGEGWQLWETVSEGSPITPVFATPEELATHLSAPGYQWGAMSAMTYENALRFVQGPGWAPTMMSSNDGVIKDGATAVAEFVAANRLIHCFT